MVLIRFNCNLSRLIQLENAVKWIISNLELIIMVRCSQIRFIILVPPSDNFNTDTKRNDIWSQICSLNVHNGGLRKIASGD